MTDFTPEVKRVSCDGKKTRIVVVIDDNSISGTLKPNKKPYAEIFDFPGVQHDAGDLKHDDDEKCWHAEFANNSNAPYGYAIVKVFFTTEDLEKTVVPILDVVD